MAANWPGCSENAVRALTLAMEIAAEFETGEVGTGHLLLAFLRVEGCEAFQLLRLLEVAPDELERQTIALLPPPVTGGPESQVSTELGRAINAAMSTVGVSNRFVRTEHLLIGLVEVEEGVAGRALRCVGVDRESVRVALDE